MPPKKGAPSKKTVQKQQEKVIQDRTFGLKNKNKSAKVQKYVQAVAKQVTDGQGKAKKTAKRPDEYDKAKEAQAARDDPRLFAPVASNQAQKVAKGVDPKSILCEFFKAGACRRGDKCKFSHDPAIERKAAKIDLYTDLRAKDQPEQDETMEGWDQAKLESVIQQKHSALNRPTDIVCRYFLQAIEEKKYGWFWQCPNGEGCLYRHALPPGFVLKSDKKEETVNDTPLEELIEEQRANLTKSTPLTLELFLEFKARKKAKRDAEALEKRTKKGTEGGRSGMSGREMFVFNPDLFVDDDSAMESDDLKIQEQQEEGYVLEATATSLRRTHVGGGAAGDEAATSTSSSSSSTFPEGAFVVNGVIVDVTLFETLEGIPELEYE